MNSYVARRVIYSVSSVLLLSACITRPFGSFVAVAVEPVDAQFETLAEDIVGEHCVGSLFGIGDPRPSYAVAVEQAVASVPGGTAMADVSVYFECRDLALLVYPRFCAIVKGDVGAFR